MYVVLTTELQKRLTACQSSLSAVYDSPTMNTKAYRLHAVLVHQGQASGGHYWAYIKKTPSATPSESHKGGRGGGEGGGGGGGEGHGGGDGDRGEDGSGQAVTVPHATQTHPQEMLSQSQEHHSETDTEQARIDEEVGGVEDMQQDGSPGSLASDSPTKPPSSAAMATQTDQGWPLDAGRDIWLKFNDISVSEVDWEEVKRESFGGGQQPSNGNTSAYCLLYISREAEEMWEGKGEVIAVSIQVIDISCMYYNRNTIVRIHWD